MGGAEAAAQRRGGGRLRSAVPWLALLLSLNLLSGCTGNMAPVSGPEAALVRGYYVVETGDTLYSIAWRNGLDYRAVARWNRIGPPYRIYPGQRIRLSIPARSAAAPRRGVPASRPSRPAPRPAAVAERRTPPSTPTAKTAVWQWPSSGKLTRTFSADAQGKQGVEFSGRLGEPIAAAAAGRVVYAGDGLRGYGNLIIVKHDSRYLTAYGYNQKLLVKEGDAVKAGQRIATMGVGASQQPALHFELRRDGKPVDPLSYLPAR